jgi:hypothetical protein
MVVITESELGSYSVSLASGGCLEKRSPLFLLGKWGLLGKAASTVFIGKMGAARKSGLHCFYWENGGCSEKRPPLFLLGKWGLLRKAAPTVFIITEVFLL